MRSLILALLITTAAADVSIYRGLATTHLFMDNTLLNNSNAVTVVKVDDLLAGTMLNSYGEDGYFVGYQPKVYDSGRWEVYAGAVAVQGYRRWQLPYLRSTQQNYLEKVTAVAPVVSVSFDLIDAVSIQCNNMSLVVVNCGLRVDF